tara:strand:+ start:1736 stop:2416 length:681 start_codon:yes stop_codon:yes gene_type:complete
MLFGFNAFASSPFSGEVDTTKVAVTGQAVSSAVGTTSIKSQPPVIQVTGLGLNATLGTFAVLAGGQVAIDASSEPAMDFTLGSPTVSGSALVQPSGLSTSVALGTVLTRLGVPVGGVEVSSALGTVTPGAVQNQVISVSGLSTSVTLGAGYVVEAGALTQPSGVVVSSAVGTPVILTEVIALPSGVSISSNLGIIGTVAWREVDDSGTNTWTKVDDNATNNWLDAA